MAVSTIANCDIRIKHKTYTAPASAQHISISANTVDEGYQFLTWVGCTTTGYVGVWNIEFLNQQNTNAWALEGTSSFDRTVNAFYLEKRI